MPGQLVLPFGVRSALKREDFIVAPCNEEAFGFVTRWPDWPARAAAIYGPKGCGKSHLAGIWQTAASALRVGAQHLASAEPALFESYAAIAIEDLDMTDPSLEQDRILLSLFERSSVTLLLTGGTAPSQWPVTIGDLRSRYDALLAFPMWAPDETLLSRLIRKHFADRQLHVTDSVVMGIVTHIERTPEAVAAFVARTDHKALAEKRPINERLVMELIEAGQKGN